MPTDPFEQLRLIQSLGALQQQQAEERKLAQMAQESPIQPILNEGQTLGGLWNDPTPAQQRGLLAASLELMGHDPRRLPGQTVSSGIAKGLNLLDTMRANEQAREMKAQALNVESAREATDFWHTYQDRSPVFKPSSPSYKAITEWVKPEDVGNPNAPSVKAVQVDGEMRNPNTGEKLDLTGLVKRSSTSVTGTPKDYSSITPTDAGKLAALTTIKANTAVLRESLLGEGNNNVERLAKLGGARIGFPVEATRKIEVSRKAITEARGRLMSGSTIRADEMMEYRDLLVPVWTDALSPGLIERKLDAQDHFADTVKEIIAVGKNNPDEQRRLFNKMERELVEIMTGDYQPEQEESRQDRDPQAPQTPAYQGVTPGGTKFKVIR